MGNLLFKKTLTCGVIFFFLVSAVTSMVVGYYAESEKLPLLEPLTTSAGTMDSAWPMFCHDVRHTSRSPYDTSGNTLYEKWKIELNGYASGSSAVIAEDGTIYIGVCGPGLDGTLHAINPDGTEKWEFIIKHIDAGDVWYIDSPPAIAEDGTIYIGSHNDHLYAINPDGTEKWNVSLDASVHSSPAIAKDGTIYIATAQAYPVFDGTFYAITPDGDIKWKFDPGYAIGASAAIGDDGIIYVPSHNGILYAIYPDTGEIKWSNIISTSNRPSCYSSPAIDDNGIIYIGTISDLYAIRPDGSVKWKYSNMISFIGGPSIGSDGTIYVSGDEQLWAFNPEDGTKKWSLWMGEDAVSPAITNNGRIYTTNGQGGIVSSNFVCLVSHTGERIYNLRLTGRNTSDKSHLLSSPAIGSDGTIYIGSWFYTTCPSHGYLHAIGTIEKTENKPPYKPILLGPPNGKINNEYVFTTSAVEPEADPIYFCFDWGDGTEDEWLGPYESVVSTDFYHTWTEQGSYQVKVKARDQYITESEWSDIETISISKNKPINKPFLNFLENHPILFQLLQRFFKL